MRREPRLHVIGVQDRVAGRVRHTLSAQHGAEHPGDAGDSSLTPRRRGDGTETAPGRRLHDGVAGQVGREVLPDADRPHARAAAAVRDAEGLVEVQVANVGADDARRSEAELGVHVRAVHVDLAPVVVDDLADLLDPVLEEGPRRGVGHHERREAVLVVLAKLPELLEVHAPGVFDPLDFHVTHRGRGGIGAMRRPRDDAHVAVAFAFRLQILSDH
mmetsp:Transcript_4854/g.12182  ORF Transcript_4854/g.12182 Transcript_4854/m.12182 type:complete len:216 (+) Transcript_4854:666-1313(+)